MPKEGEMFGVVEMMLGGDRMQVNCNDGKVRKCRIPGRMRKRVWIRTGDLVLIKPWIVQSDERADIAFRYTPTQTNWLRRKGIIE